MGTKCLAAMSSVFLLFLIVSGGGEARAQGPAATNSAPAIKNSACLECHSDQTLYKTNAAGEAVWLFIDEAKFLGSIHKTNSCASCHSDLTAKHPDDNVGAKPVHC